MKKQTAVKPVSEKTPKPRFPAKPVIQTHHLSYEPPITVDIYKGEHKILTELNWFTKKKLSAGFVKALKHWIALNEDRAKEVKK